MRYHRKACIPMPWNCAAIKWSASGAKKKRPRRNRANRNKKNKSAQSEYLSKKKRKTSFYRSPEWKQLRYETLVKYGPRCQCCGATTRDGATMNVDHIIPISKAWDRRLDPTNLQILCATCNHGKTNRDQTDWREQPELPSEGSETDIMAMRMGVDYKA